MLAAATGMSSHVANTRSGAAPNSLSITAAASVGAIGAASACNAASACCASSGRPSAMKLTIWPTFIITPFICPSSLATSAAVRMANWASSSARRSAGVISRLARVVAKRPALRAVSFHTRRDRHDIAALRPAAEHDGGGTGADPAGHDGGDAGRPHPRSGRRGDAARRRVLREQLVGQRFAGDLVRPVRAVLEPLQRAVDAGEVIGELVEWHSRRRLVGDRRIAGGCLVHRCGIYSRSHAADPALPYCRARGRPGTETEDRSMA